MHRSFIAGFLCFGLLCIDCGGAAPSAENPGSHSGGEVAEENQCERSSTEADERFGDMLAADPETTEEVIETSQPLD